MVWFKSFFTKFSSRICVFLLTFWLVAFQSNAEVIINKIKNNAKLNFRAKILKTASNTLNNDNDYFFNTLGPKLSPSGSVKEFKVISQTIRIEKKSILYNSGSLKSIINSKNSSENSFNAKDKLPIYQSTYKPKFSFEKPILGKVSSKFGYRRHPLLFKTHGTFFHSGIDIPAKRGTQIKASAAGKVVYAGWKKGYGLMVEIDHGGGFKTLYAHCSKILVKAGSFVNSKQVIGLVGSTGVTTGSHLHFEIKYNNRPINPLIFLAY